MGSSTRRTVYILHQFSWRFRANGSPLLLDDGQPGRPVKAFAKRDRADAHCRQLNLQKRATANPFWHMPEATDGSCLDQYTAQGEAAFLALVGAEGLAPPEQSSPSGDYDEQAQIWAEWWEEHRKEWDDPLVERLWNALDRVTFYEVVELELEPRVERRLVKHSQSDRSGEPPTDTKPVVPGAAPARRPHSFLGVRSHLMPPGR